MSTKKKDETKAIQHQQSTKTKKKKKKKQKRPKTESDNKCKEQRRKILEFRRMQSRFVADTEDKGSGDEYKTDNDVDTVQFVQLNDSQQDDINNLEIAFEEYDEDYYGFIEYDKFLSILKQNRINLSSKQETFIMTALTLIDEGVDYYGFLQIVRNKARISPDYNLTKICQQMAINAEQKANV